MPAARMPLPGGSGRPLDAPVQQQMQQVFGRSFASVRVHDDAASAAQVAAMGARAMALGTHIVFGPGHYAPRTPVGQRLLAHELAHTVQQRGPATRPSLHSLRAAEFDADQAAERVQAGQRVGSSVAAGLGPVPQFDLEDPGRLATVHGNIFPAASAAGGGTSGSSVVSSQPWQPASAPGGGTAAHIIQQVRTEIRRLVREDSDQVAEPPINTSEADVDRDVLVANTRLRARFPQISVTVSDAQLQAAAGVLTRTETDDPVFQHEWLWNTLLSMTDLGQFAIAFGDPDAVTLLDDLLADSELGPRLRTMSRRVGGMHTGTGLAHTIRVNRGVNDVQRSAVLLHELIHMFAHDAYTRWVATTANEGLYDEGITEWLARREMTTDELAVKTRYMPRVQRVETEIVPHVSEDDIARAYFQGEVWRLESRSDIARERFAADSGIEAGASGRREHDQSRAGPGLTQEVLPDAHYRFLNLGNDIADPKPEHVDYFRRLKTRLLDAQPSTMVKFIGHASSPGPRSHNERLSLQRAQAFYRMARAEGLDASRLRDESPPEHHGEAVPTLTEEDVQTRAFNRRVEMRLMGVAATPGGSPGTPAVDRPPTREDER